MLFLARLQAFLFLLHYVSTWQNLSEEYVDRSANGLDGDSSTYAEAAQSLYNMFKMGGVGPSLMGKCWLWS